MTVVSSDAMWGRAERGICLIIGATCDGCVMGLHCEDVTGPGSMREVAMVLRMASEAAAACVAQHNGSGVDWQGWLT